MQVSCRSFDLRFPYEEGLHGGAVDRNTQPRADRHAGNAVLDGHQLPKVAVSEIDSRSPKYAFISCVLNSVIWMKL